MNIERKCQIDRIALAATTMSEEEYEVLLLGLALKGKLPEEKILSEIGKNAAEFETVGGMIAAKPEEILDRTSFNEETAIRISAIGAILTGRNWKRLKEADFERTPILAASAAKKYLVDKFASERRETFGIVMLNARNTVIGVDDLFTGSVASSTIYPRVVVSFCIFANAAAVILYHNHPSGMADPSASDVEVTKRLVGILAEIEVRVLDHIVVGRSEAVSMREKGLFPPEDDSSPDPGIKINRS